MLDPKEMKKGGFGAAAARHREQRAERDTAALHGAGAGHSSRTVDDASGANGTSAGAADARAKRAEKTTKYPLDADTTRPTHQ